MQKILSSIFFFSYFMLASAQEGVPLLTHFRESREIENQNWAVCQDADNVMLFANRKGVLSFDGQEWRSFRLPVIPFSMKANPVNGKIYIGGEDNYGILEKDQMGTYQYLSLSDDSVSIGIITKIVFQGNHVWFYGDHSLSCYNLEMNSTEYIIPTDGDHPYTGLVKAKNNIYVNMAGKGLFRIEADTLFPIVTGYMTTGSEILFSLPYNDTHVLVGFSDGTLSLFDGIKYYDYKIKDDNYLKENLLSEGIAIGDSLYVFTTLDGGAVIAEKVGGKVRYTINNQNGLPDDEIFASGMDSYGGLWLSHQYGLTRVDLCLPVRNFSIYPGIKGNLTTSIWYNNELFVGTSEGVFYLAQVNNYDQIKVLVKDNTHVNASDKTGVRKSIFSKIFGRKISNENSKEKGASDKNGRTGSNGVEAKYVKKTVSRLKSVNYVFRKVENFNAKCRQLVSTKNGILAATNKGLYLINGHRATLLVNYRYINFIDWKPLEEKYYIASDNGYFYVSYSDNKWKRTVPDPEFSDPVYSVTHTDDGLLWLGIDNAALMMENSGMHDSITYKKISIENDFPQRYILGAVHDTIWLFTESSIYYYSYYLKTFVRRKDAEYIHSGDTRYTFPVSDMPWIRRGDDWTYIDGDNPSIKKIESLLKVFGDILSISRQDSTLWILDGKNRLFKIDPCKDPVNGHKISVLIKSIYDERGINYALSDIKFRRGRNIIYYDIVAPEYLNRNNTLYQYKINNLTPGWSPWSHNTSYNIMIPSPGNYRLMVRAKDVWGNISEAKTVDFVIKARFTQTTFFYFLMGFLILFILFLIVRFREQQLQRKNRILEDKVEERTAEIAAQKAEITASIEYASRIQRAMLPVNEHFRIHFPDSFIIFKPRDIVSGDFYWIGETHDKIFFTVADCTGHGVPGAFLSALGISALNEILTNHDDLQAGSVLDLLRDKVITSLHQTGKEGEAKDGMDIAMCVLSKDRKKMQFAGAFNPLLIIRDGACKEYRADRMPIGIFCGDCVPFTNHSIELEKGDAVYIFSDGFTDQFGGPDGTKYKKSNLKKLLLGINHQPMNKQCETIENEFRKWKGSVDQLDDVTIVGIRI